MKLCRVCGRNLPEENTDNCDFCTERLVAPPNIAPMGITECLEEIVCLVLPDCAEGSRWDCKIRNWLERAGYRFNNELYILECITTTKKTQGCVKFIQDDLVKVTPCKLMKEVV